MTKYLEIGQIVNTFGIKGMVKIKPFTDDIKKFTKLKKIYIKNKAGKKEYEIEEIKEHKGMMLVKFKGIDNPNDAELLRDSYLIIDRENLDPLEEGTFYIVDLLGINVYTEDGKLLGILDDIFNTGSNDIYVVKDELGKQLLLPAIKDVIKEISVEESKMIVHLIDGIL